MLDNTAVHPESYDAAEKLLALCGYTLADVQAGNLGDLPARLEAIRARRPAAEACGVGVPTLRDVAAGADEAGPGPPGRAARAPSCAPTCWRSRT